MNQIIRSAFPVNVGYAPAEGPKTLPVELDFSTASMITENFVLENQNGIIQFIQSVYVDNIGNSNPFIVEVPATQFRLQWQAGQSGFQPILAPLPTPIVFRTTPSTGLIIRVQLLNIPVASYQTGPVNVNANVVPVARGSYTDYSSTITTGGTSQTAIPLNAARLGAIIQNPTSEIESIFINFTSAATGSGDSIEITPGGEWTTELALTTEEITIVAATTGHPYVAKELA